MFFFCGKRNHSFHQVCKEVSDPKEFKNYCCGQSLALNSNCQLLPKIPFFISSISAHSKNNKYLSLHLPSLSDFNILPYLLQSCFGFYGGVSRKTYTLSLATWLTNMISTDAKIQQNQTIREEAMHWLLRKIA